MAPSFHPRLAALNRSIGLLLIVAWFQGEASSVTRRMPAHFTPGIAFSVNLEVQPDPDTTVYAVEEQLPPGWSVSSPSHGGVMDSKSHALKWGPFIDPVPVIRVLTYTVTPPMVAPGGFTWSGEGRFNRTRVLTEGDSRTARFPGELGRQLPLHYLPGQALGVVLTAQPALDVRAYAVEERVPSGWEVSGISDGGEFDALNRKIKWGPFTDPVPLSRHLTFTLLPGARDSGQVEFLGRAVFDSVEVLAAGSLIRKPSRVTPMLPPSFEPGGSLRLELEVEPAPFVQVHAVQQQLPEGWTASALSHGGVVDPATRQLKWGPFTEAVPLARRLTAQLLPPPGATGVFAFPGTGVFDLDQVPFSSETRRYLQPADSGVTRVLPPEFEPGIAVVAELRVSPREGSQVYSVEDTLPAGWTLVSLSAGGIFDAASRKVKWGPIFAPDTVERVLTYQVQSSPEAAGSAAFDGVGWFDDRPRIIVGDRLTVASVGRIWRTLPPRYTPGASFPIRLDTAPGAATEVYAVEEELPAGWTFESATEGGIFDPLNRRVKWGPFPDRTRRTLVCRATPPEGVGAETEFRGAGVFNHAFLNTTGTGGAVRNNRPRAIPNSAGRVPGEAFKISAIKILLNDSDPDGDFLTVTEVSPLSTEGARVDFSWPWIYYTPPPGYDGSDTFTYTVSDGYGGVSSALIRVEVVPPSASSQNLVSIDTLPDGSRRLRFAGVPGYTYHIEASVDLSAWVRLGDVTASLDGRFESIDTDAPAFPIRYYRSTWP